VLEGAPDARAPRDLHPAFYGSYDWHSCVHMHWLLARLRREFPDIPQRSAINGLLDEHFSQARIAGELAYLRRPSTESFERTYGWAWLLKLTQELHEGTDHSSRRWKQALAPLADQFVQRYLRYLPRAHYPLRYGVHNNSAFGLLFALDYARATQNVPLADLCLGKARAWYLGDRDAPGAWEPSGADFLSPVLIEAALMSRVLATKEFAAWLGAFLPKLSRGEPATLFAPAIVSDRGDPQSVHLDGLNWSRAWCYRLIAAALPARDARRAPLREAAERHIEAGMTGLTSSDYLGAHWLATFAALALSS
jgi:Protein of unknown function (DUF2891)